MSQPVHQNLLCSSEQDATRITRGDLSMAVCLACGFVFNTTFDPSRLEYGAGYENDQMQSPAFSAHVERLVRRLVEDRGVTNQLVVEVGCGKGDFLSELVTRGENRGIGFDPSYRGPENRLDGKLRFRRQFYSRESQDIDPDVVISRHVIEHIDDPRSLVRELADALAGSPRARVFFETPSVEWILENLVIWDFFYEHCSLFSESSLAALFEQNGFRVKLVDRVFEGQYLWLEAEVGETKVAHTHVSDIPVLARQFGRKERSLLQDWQRRISDLRRSGKVSIWGAGAKGVTFANLLDPERALIDSVVDLNPAKQGKFIPGTGHPIVSYRELAERNIRHSILMNPNYRLENESLLRDEKLDIQLIE